MAAPREGLSVDGLFIFHCCLSGNKWMTQSQKMHRLYCCGPDKRANPKGLGFKTPMGLSEFHAAPIARTGKRWQVTQQAHRASQVKQACWVCFRVFRNTSWPFLSFISAIRQCVWYSSRKLIIADLVYPRSAKQKFNKFNESSSPKLSILQCLLTQSTAQRMKWQTFRQAKSSSTQKLSKWETRTCTLVMYTGELSVVQTKSKLDSSASITDELN